LRRTIFIPLIVLTLLLAGCKSTYYKTMRTLGKEKRDILVQRIKDAKKDQDQTKQQLQTTMESFQVADLVKSIDASSQEADKLISSLAASDNKN
jgi:predicted GTPase